MANDTARKASGPQPIVYVGAALVLLGAALFAYVQWGPNRTVPEEPLTPEGKAYVKNLKLNDVDMRAAESYMAGRVVEIVGQIGNDGDRPLESVEIYCIFSDSIGQLVLRKRVPIVNKKMGGLKPGETKSFRLPFDDIPESWNQALPQLVIASVKFS